MSPWFSVWGLVADMAGVAIITYDIWPEYSLHRLRQDLEFQHKAVAARAHERRPAQDGAALRAADGALDLMARGQLDRSRRKLGLLSLPGRSDLLSDEQIEASKRETVAALSTRFSTLGERNRPPLGVGVFLVVAGFVLQTIGAWPH